MHEQVDGVPGAWYSRHRWWADPVAMALLAVVMAALGFRGVWGSFSLLSGPVSPWWALAFALPACGLALAKRRLPVTVLGLVSLLFVADLLTVGGIGTVVVLLDVLWTAVFLSGPRRRRVLLVLLSASTVILFVAAWLFTDMPFAVAFLVGVQFGAIFGTDYWWAVAVSQAQELAELHRQRADDAAAVAERDRVEAVQREREAMARELHDVVAGHVMAMAIRAEAALSTTPDQTKDREALQAVRDAGLDAHGALRSMISVLRRGDGALVPTPRWADLEGIVREAERAGLVVRFDAPDAPELGAAAEQTVVRIVREALTNCTRHAGGADVDVEIKERNAELQVRVRSRGGVASAAATHGGEGWGLQLLRERVGALGGFFAAGPDADGWSVEGRLPLEVRV
ncbi:MULTISPECIES: sensor histidine kinase [unclassified Microbacterium]|uniref:sensor histidine kinase n=1 Tax=unclassified Microbacterium TaxID=2609290 RepID=UPI00109C2E5A|nr:MULTISPECIES: histidine kinase [unclassified Microbacterium]